MKMNLMDVSKLKSLILLSCSPDNGEWEEIDIENPDGQQGSIDTEGS
jgi:hypothetical protein